MTNMKYEFVEGDERVVAPGVVVKRIRALVAISATFFAPAVAPGDMGGYVQSEANLMVSGSAWVYGNAWVYGDAQVSGDAQVYGDARVYGNARVYGDGLVFWASKVGTENGTLTAYSAKGDAILVTRGCFLGTAAEFLAKSAKEHDERTHREYGLLLEVAKSRIDAARASTPRPIGDQP